MASGNASQGSDNVNWFLTLKQFITLQMISQMLQITAHLFLGLKVLNQVMALHYLLRVMAPHASNMIGLLCSPTA